MSYADRINQLTRQYNEAIRSLERDYDMESIKGSWFSGLSNHSLKRQYSARYESLVSEYRSQCRQVLVSEKKQHPAWAKGRTVWSRVFIIGFIALLGSCVFSMPSDEPSNAAPMVSETTQEKYWNAENIPIPHLQDASQYVSNPDGVLTQPAVNIMNERLKLMDDSLGIETVVIAVNHIENDDPFRMAQDVGNRYGVGRSDRGLVIVLGYEDHSINISPGRSLEADLTDAECHRLQQEYVVPAMRAEMPDSGMVYLVEAIYSTLFKKQLPQMSTLTSSQDEAEDELAKTLGIFMLLFIGWTLLFFSLNRKYQWMGLVGGVSLLGNPFAEHSSGGFFIGGGGGHGGGFGGGGFGGGGSFGGGSFGGGGATSRW